MRKNMKRLLDTSDGFVSSYFLVLLMNICLLVGVYQGILSNSLQTWIHIKAINERLPIEAKVIARIKCDLLKDELSEGSFSMDDISGYIIVSDVIRIEVSEPYGEVIELEFKDKEIMGMNIVS